MRNQPSGGEYHRLMRVARPTSSLCGLLGACLALSACGSGTKTVSISSAPPSSTQGSTAGSTATIRTAPSQGTTTGATATATTRSAPEPAFTEQEHASAGLSAATAVLRARGFTPADTADYHPDQALEVLIGVRGSGDDYGQQAFFFVNGRFIGTDTSQPSGGLRLVSQSDTEVTLAYPLYRSSDPLCCPSGGLANVRFQLNDGKLTPLDPIPPLHSATGLSRY